MAPGEAVRAGEREEPDRPWISGLVDRMTDARDRPPRRPVLIDHLSRDRPRVVCGRSLLQAFGRLLDGAPETISSISFTWRPANPCSPASAKSRTVRGS